MHTLFRFDFSGNKQLDEQEFDEALRYAGVFLTTPELHVVMRHFDKDGNGNVSFDEFLTGLRGQMNERRQAIVMQAFNILDRDG